MKQLLLVDDDEPFRKRLAEALEKRGWSVISTMDCATAAHTARVGVLAGAIVDLRLGRENGLQLIRSLRQASETLRIVVLTGFGSIATSLEALRLGANDYLTKPCDTDTILGAVLGTRIQPDEPELSTQIPSLDRVEWEHIQRVLTGCGGNISKAARLLGINRRSLQRKLGKYPPTH